MTTRRKRWKPSDGVDLRYVTERRDKQSLRRYWQRKGHPLVRLPDGPEWIATATHLNRQADGAKARNYVVPESVAWFIRKYRRSDRFKALSASSVVKYERWLKEFEAWWADLPITAITRRVVLEAVERHGGKKSTQRQMAAVLYNVLDEAIYRGALRDNPASRLRIGGSNRRDARWSDEARWTFLRQCRDHPHGAALRMFFHLLYYTGQRPADVLAMRWSQFDGSVIELRQQKTGKLLTVPCHRSLRRVLGVARRSAVGLVIVARANGQPWNQATLGKLFQRVRDDAGLDDLQARDLRRTAAIALAEVGCTEVEVAAITGHNIETTRQILEHYIPRTRSMAEAAVLKWEQGRTKSLTR